MYSLRKYQGDAIVKAIEFFMNPKRKKTSYMVLPTAAGKSIVIAYIANELDEPVLCLQPTKELLEQNYAKFISYGGKASIFSASKKSKEIGEVTFATIGSIYKNPELFRDFRYVIIDECHLVSPNEETEEKDASMYVKFLTELDVKILGLTATPFRMRFFSLPEQYSIANMLHRTRPRLFEDLIYVKQIEEMIDEGYWSDLEYISVPFSREKVQVNSKGSNFVEISVNEELKKQGVVENAIKWAKELKGQGFRKVLIFAPSVAVAEVISKGLRVNSISSKTKPADREYYLKQFAEGKDWAVVNVNVLAIGYDNPEIDAIIDLAPTLSLSRYYQKYGRGIRISPKKKFCLILDMVGNTKMFGRIEDIKFVQVKGQWCVMCGKKNLSERKYFKATEVPELDRELVKYGKYANNIYKNIPVWYLKFVVDKLKETDENKELIYYAKCKLNKF